VTFSVVILVSFFGLFCLLSTAPHKIVLEQTVNTNLWITVEKSYHKIVCVILLTINVNV